mmetsp:Transcript_33813/g.49631  ORF Transcript_33813/g.49631 Transcript_33813/m.49631 type:complete len:98 (-) Transcript_33813:905-1198(-)
MARVVSSSHKKKLNLCHSWLRTFLSKFISKINRVSFSLLNSDFCQKAPADDPSVPRSTLVSLSHFLVRQHYKHYNNPQSARALHYDNETTAFLCSSC